MWKEEIANVTIEPNIDKLQTTVSVAKRSAKEKPQPRTNNHQTAGGDFFTNLLERKRPLILKSKSILTLL